MRIETVATFNKQLSSHLLGITVIVVDVLRATTNIIWALKNGANKVIPAVDPGEAALLMSRLGARECVLAGESGGIKLNGFNIGNSPSEFDRATVRDKNVIMSTSNGTSAICGLGGAKNVLIGAMINKTAVAREAVRLGDDIKIVCAGTERQLSADDIVCAGAIASAIAAARGGDVEMCDLTRISCMLYDDYMDGRADFSVTYHWRRLIGLGFGEDVEFAFRQDITDVVPKYTNGIIQ